MEGSPIDIVIFAPLAVILGVLLFWFIQLLIIEFEKYLLSKIRPNHEPLCRFTNFLGILFQSVCHALGYTITKSGISDFYISVNYGRVAPKRQKTGIFEWISNAFLFIGPFFLPAVILLIYVYFSSVTFEVVTPPQFLELKYTFAGQINTFGTNLYSFSSSFFHIFFNIDLLHPGHLGFMVLLIFLGMGMRPSYIGEKKQEKVDMFYDLKNIWSLIRHKPLYILILFLLAYNLFYISLIFNQNWYVALFSILSWLSIIAIVSLIVANLILLLIKTTDEIPGKIKLLPHLSLPIFYVLMRVIFFYYPVENSNMISLAVMVISTILITLLLLRFKTNIFKSKRDIKSLKKKRKGATDEG
jgi:hypothetical protein